MTISVYVLGTAQDGGVPHAGCRCATCTAGREAAEHRRRGASIGVVGERGDVLVVDASIDLPEQMLALADTLGRKSLVPDAFLLTHAHLGHYVGLSYLGREVMNTTEVPVYVTERMARFLRTNRPWSHLVTRKQVVLKVMEPEESFEFDSAIVTPFFSPHRAEDTDTVGVEVEGPNRRLLYLPDADRFPPDLVERIQHADVALVDGTFWSEDEVAGRNYREIPHPLVRESVEVLAGAKGTIHFTHLNHTNPMLHPVVTRRPELPEGFDVLADDTRFDL